MLYPPDSDKRVGYSRVSTIAKALDDKSGLINWQASMAMIGLMKSDALQAQVLSMMAKGGNIYHENKKPLAEIMDQATNLAGAGDAATKGTSVHTFTEMVDSETLDWAFVPEALKGPLDAYAEATAKFRVVDQEVFVTVDEPVGAYGEYSLQAAGSLDKLLMVEGLGCVVGDVKTGANEPKYPLGCTAQVATYARGLRYRDDRFRGTPEFSDGVADGNGVSFRKALGEGVSHEFGLMIHLPLEPRVVRGKSRFVCDVFVLDLVHGWRAIETAVFVREVKRVPKLVKL